MEIALPEKDAEAWSKTETGADTTSKVPLEEFGAETRKVPVCAEPRAVPLKSKPEMGALASVGAMPVAEADPEKNATGVMAMFKLSERRGALFETLICTGTLPPVMIAGAVGVAETEPMVARR